MKNKNILFKTIVVISIAIMSSAFVSFDNGNSKLGSKLSQYIQYQNTDQLNLVWIYFTDKGMNSEMR
ncbi:MAG: hypothetical protein ABI462_14265, partial [Ignavibacteria bacterium]